MIIKVAKKSVYFLEIKQNWDLEQYVPDSQYTEVEELCKEKNFPIKFERIYRGHIIFTQQPLPLLTNYFLHDAALLDENNLPEKYLKVYDSYTDETYYLPPITIEHAKNILSMLLNASTMDEIIDFLKNNKGKSKEEYSKKEEPQVQLL